MTLSKFYEVFNDQDYKLKMETAFSWFLGNNRLHQIIYNPSTGGCYDGLEETHVNLNQGAESTISYLMARFTVEKYNRQEIKLAGQALVSIEKKSKLEKTFAHLSKKDYSTLTSHYFVTNPVGMTRKEPN